MNQHDELNATIRKHRSVYRFGGAWAQAMLISIPWVNTVILTLMLILVHGKIAVTPGVLFDLPRAPIHEGMQARLTAMMIPVTRDVPGAQQILVFFDDSRFLTDDKNQMDDLADRVRQRVSQDPEGDKALLLLADKRVPYGEVMAFVNLVREAGIERVNAALKPE
jgi:biopolymer transport protein ExbD